MASSASLVATAVGSMAQPMPFSPRSTVTLAPNGAWDSRNAASASCASSGRWVGAVRSDRRKRVSGAITLKDPSTGWASKPITVTDGLVHRREASEPVPANS